MPGKRRVMETLFFQSSGYIQVVKTLRESREALQIFFSSSPSSSSKILSVGDGEVGRKLSSHNISQQHSNSISITSASALLPSPISYSAFALLKLWRSSRTGGVKMQSILFFHIWSWSWSPSFSSHHIASQVSRVFRDKLSQIRFPQFFSSSLTFPDFLE